MQAFSSYVSKVSKRVQAVLAEANVAAEEVLSTMPTVKAHGAEGSACSGEECVRVRCALQ